MKLLFAYNADSGMLAALKDAAHKAISPATYSCNLCRITYGTFFMKDEWQQYIEALPHEVQFLHRDEFRARYPDHADEPLPAVFTESSARISLAISARDINAVTTIPALIQLVQQFLSNKK